MIAAIWSAIGILAAGLFSSIYFSVQKMDAGFARIESRMDARFDALTARLGAHLDRHAG